MQEGLQILERVAEARGKILRAEGDRAGSSVGVLALTFDVGRIVIAPSDDGLEIAGIGDREGLPDGLGSLDEEGVGASGLGKLMIVKMRFREESENPRVVRLEATGSAIRVSLDEG